MNIPIFLIMLALIFSTGCASQGQNKDTQVDSALGILQPAGLENDPDQSLREVREQTYKDRDQNIQRDITDSNVL
jgi:hypothetical protein